VLGHIWLENGLTKYFEESLVEMRITV